MEDVWKTPRKKPVQQSHHKKMLDSPYGFPQPAPRAKLWDSQKKLRSRAEDRGRPHTKEIILATSHARSKFQYSYIYIYIYVLSFSLLFRDLVGIPGGTQRHPAGTQSAPGGRWKENVLKPQCFSMYLCQPVCLGQPAQVVPPNPPAQPHDHPHNPPHNPSAQGFQGFV